MAGYKNPADSCEGSFLIRFHVSACFLYAAVEMRDAFKAVKTCGSMKGFIFFYLFCHVLQWQTRVRG